MDTLTVAYHELGHALAAILYDVKFKHVTVIPKEDSLGHVLFAKYHGANEEDFFRSYDKRQKAMLQYNIDLAILTTLAGPAAEKKYTGKYNAVGARFDTDIIWTYIEKLGYSHKKDSHKKERKKNSPLTVAESYHRFKNTEAESLFTDYEGNDTKLWKAIKYLAPILVERQKMSYKEIQGLYYEWEREYHGIKEVQITGLGF